MSSPPPRPTISAFADEISPDFDVQLRTLAEHGVQAIELRSVNRVNVLQLSADEVIELRRRAAAFGLRFSAVGSPLGKFPLDGDFADQLRALETALAHAQRLEAPRIRMFSFHIPKGDDPDRHEAQVVDWLGQMVARAEPTGVALAHENEKGIFGDTGARCRRLHEAIPSRAFVAAFDFANFVQCGQRPAVDCWPLLRPYVAYFHIKDARQSDGRVAPAGEGDGDVAAILGDAIRGGFADFLTLEPHLGEAHGADGGARFGVAARALNRVLANLG
jgi:sugar phosphate isomerase/epimerase